jgi:Iron-sulfur cluster-binding domain
MEALYYVMAWACHRKCRHCYEDRFRPYARDRLEAVIAEAEAAFPRILANLPERMTWTDRSGPHPVERGGRVILSGGEALLEGVRQRVTLPVIEVLQARHAGQGLRIVVQTTGDLLTPPIIRGLLDRGVWMISVSGVDDFHVGMEGAERQAAFRSRLSAMMQAEGMRPSATAAGTLDWHQEPGPVFSFFGATPDAWIGRLWPRGRGWENGLSTATIEDNFCARWSGGRGFLDHREAGSEVSVEPDGSVYPCCVKTRRPIGNLTEERLTDILDDLAADPAWRAINAGQPQRMGVSRGWSEAEFLERSRTATPQGKPYANLCIGCDRFHEEVLGPVLAEARARRMRARERAEA